MHPSSNFPGTKQGCFWFQPAIDVPLMWWNYWRKLRLQEFLECQFRGGYSSQASNSLGSTESFTLWMWRIRPKIVGLVTTWRSSGVIIFEDTLNHHWCTWLSLNNWDDASQARWSVPTQTERIFSSEQCSVTFVTFHCHYTDWLVGTVRMVSCGLLLSFNVTGVAFFSAEPH